MMVWTISIMLLNMMVNGNRCRHLIKCVINLFSCLIRGSIGKFSVDSICLCRETIGKLHPAVISYRESRLQALLQESSIELSITHRVVWRERQCVKVRMIDVN